MSDAVNVMMSKAELEKMSKAMAVAADINEQLRRDLEVARTERRQALDAANRASVEADRLRKIIPDDKVQAELKALRTAMGEAHKQISALEKELAAARAETEAKRKEAAQTLRRVENVQITFDTLHVARDKACADRDKALADLKQGVEAYQKLQAEHEALKKAVAFETKAVKKAPPAQAAAPAQV